MLYKNLPELEEKLPEDDLSLKNAKGRVMVRAIIGVLKTENNPKLKKEYTLLSKLLTHYGSPSSLKESCRVLILLAKQTYMHYLQRIRELEAPNTQDLAAGLKKVKKFHKFMKERNKSRSQTGDEVIISQQEKELINSMDKFIEKYDYKSHAGERYLNSFCKKYSFAASKKKLLNFLLNLDSKFPLPVLEYFDTVWHQRKKLE